MNPLLSLQLNENFLEKRFGDNIKKKEDYTYPYAVIGDPANLYNPSH
jgi:hypothetical protein